jgi:2-methylcitrate dehydratase PrpD
MTSAPDIADTKPVDTPGVADGRPGLVIHEIAAYVDAARRKVVSEADREAASRCVLDLLTAAMAGFGERGAGAARTMALTVMVEGDTPIWFDGLSSSVIGAAWANSAAAAALDLDDGNRVARGHPGAAVIPTALAVGHQTRASWDDILRSIVIGYEVGVSIASARLSYGNTGTWSSYATVATAAALRGTPPDVLAHALAIAGESSPSQAFLSAPAQSPPPEGSDVKEGIPWSVVTGLVALGLAEAGATGPRNILDSVHHYSFPDALALGSIGHVRNTYFKLYACCRHIHAPLDALLALIAERKFDPRSIDRIEVETYSGALRLPNTTNPDNLVDVQYSIPYCLALGALVGPSALLPLTNEALGRPEVCALARKVELSLDDRLDSRFPAETLARVIVSCEGERHVSAITTPKGEASNPLTWTELEEKLRTATRLVARSDQQEQLLNAIRCAATEGPSALGICLKHRLTTPN